MSIADNVKSVQDSVAKACAKAGRDPAEVSLVAISKLKPAQDILEAAAAGLEHFGENRVEEGVAKIPQVNDICGRRLTWHMVGHVQSRKVKLVLPLFDLVQSVDSLRLAQRFSRLSGEAERRLDVLLEVNVSGEATKFGLVGYNWYRDGVVKEALWKTMVDILALPNLRVKGLMTMAPYDAVRGDIRRVFADLFALREELSSSFEVALPELSMGMTNDFPIAIEEGATMIRIGRAIFGERQ